MVATVTGEFYVEFSTSGSITKKRAKVDDVVVSVAGSTATELVAEVTTLETSYKFDNLETGCNYRYRVQAQDNYGSSAFSSYQDVTIITGITEFTGEDSVVDIYTLTGIKVYSGTKEGVKAAVPGVYVVKSGSKSYKGLMK